MRGKFYPANDKGSYSMSARPICLMLCREYLWVGETLSIPLSSITNMGLTKHGGYIEFWDAVAGAAIRLNITKVWLLFFHRKAVEELVSTISRLRTECPPTSAVALDDAAVEDSDIICEKCGSTDAHVLMFHVFRFVGIAPIAYAYQLTPFRYVLCAGHARGQAIRCGMQTAMFGYLGFPGCLAAPWYICKNLWILRRSRISDWRTVLLCLLGCVILPMVLIATPIVLLLR